MTYKEFKDTYRWTLKNYPATDNLFYSGRLIRYQETRYERPAAGARWIETKRGAVQLVTPEFYMNGVDAVPFFRSLGGSETVETAPTYHGKLPVKITSVSPDGTRKTVREFFFSRF